jgi:histidyl-tRNA synthetase
LSEYLVPKGWDALCTSLIRLTSCRHLEEVFAVTGDIPEKKRIEELFSILDKTGIPYTLDPGIARGLDYYTGMVFEIFAQNLGTENQVLGGGTYRLAHLFGGEDTPSCGFAIGFDRVMVSRGDQAPPHQVMAGIAYTPAGRDWALIVAREFRAAGIRTEFDLSERSLTHQISRISKSADYALIIGEREKENTLVTLKNLISGIQKELTIPEAILEVTGSELR